MRITRYGSSVEVNQIPDGTRRKGTNDGDKVNNKS